MRTANPQATRLEARRSGSPWKALTPVRVLARLAVVSLSLLCLYPCAVAAQDDAQDGLESRSPDTAPVLSAPHGSGPLFYFFSPDWRPPDLGKLTIAVEQALAAGGIQVSFQAFTRYEDFERQIADAPPQFLLAPAWLASSPASAPNLSLTVLVRPMHRGKSTYRKALMTRPGMDSIDDLARGSIAATLHSMSAGSSAAVLDAFHLAADSARVVPVPKDIDALLALSFGQVDAALITSPQYEQLSRTNPREAERLRVLAFSPEIRLPPVFATASADPAMRGQLRDVLVRLGEQPAGQSVLAMLGFDAFVAGPEPAANAEATRGGSHPAADAASVAAAAAPSHEAVPPAAPAHSAATPPARPKKPAPARPKRPRTATSHRR